MDKGNEATASALGPMSLMERQCLFHVRGVLPVCREVVEAQDSLILRGYAMRGVKPGTLVLTSGGLEAMRRVLAASAA